MGILRLHSGGWYLMIAIVLVGLLGVGSMIAGTGRPETGTTENNGPVAQETKKKQQQKPKKQPTVCRLFFQDHAAKTVHWADVKSGEHLSLTTPELVTGFPRLDAESQNLVQMEQSLGTLLVGVRDQEDGTQQSGWVFLDSGVKEESHGDHAHWYYKTAPRVIETCLDKKQGNPAHLYCYQGKFYLANDRNSGYTRFDPQQYRDDPQAKLKTGFQQGGGNHITLAVVDEKTGYSTWIDGGGPNKGRVDVTRIQPDGNDTIAYSVTLPHGAIHGATTCGGKVFFAPADGINWCAADLDAQPHNQSQVKLQHISLGKDEETGKPCRTGAFVTHRNYVCFVSGKGSAARFCLLDAGADTPAVISVPLQMAEGNSPASLEIVKTAWGKRLAFVFHNHPRELELQELLSLIDLDPNGDLDFQDARLMKTLDVGPSQVEGHYGHHTITFDQAGRYGFWTEPGAGTIRALSLETFEPLQTFQVNGVPTKVIAVGQQDRKD